MSDWGLGNLTKKLTDAVSNGAKDVLDIGEVLLKNDENPKKEGQSDLQKFTDMLNNSFTGQHIESQFGIDASKAKKGDNYTIAETAQILANVSEGLIDNGYLNEGNTTKDKQKEAKTQLKEELGSSWGNIKNKDSLIIFIATPEAERQDAINKASHNGDLKASIDNSDAPATQFVIDGKPIDMNSTSKQETMAYIEVTPNTPDLDMG